MTALLRRVILSPVMDRMIAQGRLYDFYGELLTPHQRSIYEAAVYEDMSLSEIADREGMTRQGVSDLVKRISRKLHEYEQNLRLSERTEQAEQVISELSERISKSSLSETEKAEFVKLCGRLSEML